MSDFVIYAVCFDKIEIYTNSTWNEQSIIRRKVAKQRIEEKKRMGNFQKVRRMFKMRSFTRNRNDPERLPLFNPPPSTSRNRSPSISSTDTNSSSSSAASRSLFRNYGSFLPSFDTLRNAFRRSRSSQVRENQK